MTSELVCDVVSVPVYYPVEAFGARRDVLFALQLLVARRADRIRELTADHSGSSGETDDRKFWLRAEQEVFERFEKALPHAAARSLE